jgi:hypothetical protein
LFKQIFAFLIQNRNEAFRQFAKMLGGLFAKIERMGDGAGQTVSLPLWLARYEEGVRLLNPLLPLQRLQDLINLDGEVLHLS